MIDMLNKKSGVVAALFFGLFCGAIEAQQMSMPGSFSVTPSGAAAYSIPIQVPPGIAGMEPSISLNYNSQSGNGPLGVGWSLSAGSVISRCPQNKAQDGAIKGVTLTYNDRFCLDGQRLVLVSGTGYGQPGSEYRTEMDSFSKIIANGTSVNGPLSFTVMTKSGQTMLYGATTDSRIEAGSGSQILKAWAISKTVDRLGNSVNYSYLKDLDTSSGLFTGSFFISKISYGGNDNKGLPANNEISFVYSSGRNDARYGYRNGYATLLNRRLDSIATSNLRSNIFTYKINYEYGFGSWSSRINNIVQCDAANVCLPATVFNFSSSNAKPNVTIGTNPTRATAQSVSIASAPVQPYFLGESSLAVIAKNAVNFGSCLITCGSWVSLDVNGDGKTDFLHMTTSPYDVRIWKSNGDGTFSISAASGNSIDQDVSKGSWQTIDVNGDGLSDLVHFTATPGLVYIWISKGDGTFKISSLNVTQDTNFGEGSWQVVDIDGDGLPDLVHIAGYSYGSFFVWKSKGDGTFSISTQLGNSSAAYFAVDKNFLAGSWFALDVDGDGLTDLVHIGVNKDSSSIWKSNGDGTFSFMPFVLSMSVADSSAGNFGSDPFYLIDLNGDGLLDLVQVTQTSGVLHVFMSMGNGQFYYSVVTSSFDTLTKQGVWRAVDMNGDGLVDLVHAASDSNFYVWTSDGKGGFTVVSLTSSSTADTCLVSCGSIQSGDIKGDGFNDFIHLVNDAGSYFYWQLPRTQKDLPYMISNGISPVPIEWNVAPLPAILNNGDGSKNATYLMDPRSPRSVSARTTLITPLRVVTDTWSSDGVGGKRRTVYSYGSATADANRGFLGFAWTQKVDDATGLTSRDYYRQDFPYAGVVSTSGQGLSPAQWNSLKLTSNTYGCFANGSTTTGCIDGPNQRYYPYLTQTTTRAWDLDGTALPISVMQNSGVDAYGNIKTITQLTQTSSGGSTPFSKVVTNNFAAPDTSKWIVDRLLSSTVVSSGPDIPASVAPSKTAPTAAAPVLPASIMAPILNLLLDD